MQVKEAIADPKQYLVDLKGLSPDWKPQFNFCINLPKYTIKVADTWEELYQTYALRYKVYSVNMVDECLNDEELDFDEYDHFCDYLIIKENETSKVLGTYRFLSSLKTTDFYSGKEFDLSEVLKIEGHKIEMGRATVHPDHRTGGIITLLWRGLSEYLRVSKAEYLIGCSSLWTHKIEEAYKAYSYIKSKGLLVPDLKALPFEANQYKGDWIKEAEAFYSNLTEEEIGQLSRQVPPLMKMYVKAKAQFFVEPGIDYELKSIDFLTLVDVSKVDDAVIRKPSV